jgi:hypothetical protein
MLAAFGETDAGGIPGLTSVSIVSHGHAELLASLLDDLKKYSSTKIEVILTLNVEESLPFDPDSFAFPIKLIRNAGLKGFAANHNSAFRAAHGEYFCVLNPDIRLNADPFPALIRELKDKSVGVAAPLILGPDGSIEDSARPFPTLSSLLCKALGIVPRRYYEIGSKSASPDWVGGMFILLRKDAFASVGGFDPGYYLYYEDVDLCARLRLRGYDIRLVPTASAVHFARRQSRRDLKYMFWHLHSMVRYLVSRARWRAEKSAGD